MTRFGGHQGRLWPARLDRAHQPLDGGVADRPLEGKEGLGTLDRRQPPEEQGTVLTTTGQKGKVVGRPLGNGGR